MEAGEFETKSVITMVRGTDSMLEVGPIGLDSWSWSDTKVLSFRPRGKIEPRLKYARWTDLPICHPAYLS
jgi:hypothetical protein